MRSPADGVAAPRDKWPGGALSQLKRRVFTTEEAPFRGSFQLSPAGPRRRPGTANLPTTHKAKNKPKNKPTSPGSPTQRAHASHQPRRSGADRRGPPASVAAGADLLSPPRPPACQLAGKPLSTRARAHTHARTRRHTHKCAPPPRALESAWQTCAPARKSSSIGWPFKEFC